MADRVIYGAAARAALLADLAARPYIEACGLLLGTITDDAWHIEDALPLRNADNSAASFEFDPEDLLRCDLEHGERIVGAYHSHLGGPAFPSRKDLRNMQTHAASPWIWLIVAASPPPRARLTRQTEQEAAAQPNDETMLVAGDQRGAAPAPSTMAEDAGAATTASLAVQPPASTPAGHPAIEVGAFRAHDTGTLLVYPVQAADDGAAGAGAQEP